MRKLLLLVFIIAISSCNPPKEKTTTKQIPQESTTDKPKIAIVGTFHFANTSDYSAIVLDDLATEKRQKELDRLVANLAEFKPTKILVEREPSLTDSLSQKLIDYKNGRYELPNNELYQIGFKLAKELGLAKIYGIDYHLNLGDEALVAFLQEQGLMDQFTSIIATSKVWAQEHTDFLKTHTLGEVLAKLNQTASEEFNRNLYLDGILNIAEEGNSPASDFVANWYKRNIYMKKNIDDLISKDDRVLVIIGAGHSSILKDFYRSSQAVEYVELSELLKK